ncbi:LP14331p [Strongyloides ratti]|uniref:ABC-type xenobiotic transporter n=1 Tax=Strongyloides ratti TaxID=34506 RepID=A0A090KTC3_STRRB|nr:LP14331p [Strongyloides ratti]CEF60730.1 LP14331p [Strongyloides ratti]
MKIFKKLRKENVDMQNITDRVKKNSTSDFEEELQKPNNLSPKPVALWDLYRYANKIDYILLFVGICLGLIQGAFNSVSSIIFKNLLDVLIKGEAEYEMGVFNKNQFHHDGMHAVYMYVGFGAAVFVLASISTACWHVISERQVHQIRKKYLAAILRQNIAWFDVNNTGSLTTKMSDGLDRIKDGTGDKVGLFVIYTANFIAGMSVAFSYSWKMSLIMVAFVPIIFGCLSAISFLSKKYVKRESEAYSEAGSVAEEVINGIRTVIAFNGQKNEINRYSNFLSKAANSGTIKGGIVACNMGLMMLFMFVAMAVSFYFGTHLVIDNEIESGMVFAVFWAFIGGVFSLGQAAPQIAVIMAARQAGGEIFEIIDRKPEIDALAEEGKILANPKGNIVFSNIKFRYPTRPDVEVLKGISFEVNEGQSVALVGHSGCGKSTTVGLLLRYYSIESGKLTFDGTPIEELNINWLRETIGIVSQEPVLFSDTISMNIKFGRLNVSDEEIINACKMANAHDFIMKLPNKYNTIIGDGGVQLSGGMKQRVAIARVLVRNPKILLLDEATSALDSESEYLVQKALENASYNRTTIVIAHKLSTIKNCDKIIVFDNGNIVESGTHNDLLSNPDGLYTKLVNAQQIEELNDEYKKDVVSELGLHNNLSSKFDRNCTKRLSKRLSISMSIASEEQYIIDELQEELEEEKVIESSILDIIKFAKEEHLYLIFSTIFSFIRGMTFPIFSIVYGQMFKTLTLSDNSQKLHAAGNDAIYFTLIGIFSAISTAISGFLISKAGEHLTCRLRISLFKNILSQNGTYFDNIKHAPGKLTNRLATDAPNVRAAIDQRLADVLQSIAAIIGSIVIAFCYGPNMAPIGILTAGSLIGLQTLVSQYLKRRGLKDSILAENPAKLASEVIDKYKTVQYLCKEKYFIEKFNNLMEVPHKRNLIRGVIAAVTFGLNSSYVMLNFGIAYRYGIWLVEAGHSTPYTVFQVIESLNCATMSLLSFATYFPEYVRARLSAGLIFYMLSLKPEINSYSEDGKKTNITGKISLKNVAFNYPNAKDNNVLNKITLDIPSGKSVALVGPSGCGKSTIIQLIERLYDPDSGSLIFDNENQKDINLQHLRSEMALVGQEPILFNLTIKDNIGYGLQNYTIEDVIAAAKLANAHNFILNLPLQYETPIKSSTLSGGQKQRIAIARAIIRKPKILLLDEATSALDTESEKIVQQALDNVQIGRTTISVSHRLSSICNYDIIVVIKDGKIIEKGNHQELLSINGLYASLISKQNLK